ncbi:MAG: Hsp70 family protein [Parachlamydiaceae bacterium]|nr:Hsp70 family protein [Parachlamydiaceae bacterium]
MPQTYIIGIDFGTTNCTMAFTAIDSANQTIDQFAIPQMTLSGIEKEETTLPSFLYFPLPEELKSHAVSISWSPDQKYCIGTFARDRGAEMPARLVWSAKSWLCQTGIDRRADLLPLGAAGEQIKVSPVQACANILKHLRQAWDNSKAETPFFEQQIFVTVPASFDPSARQLVLEAAKLAEYPEIMLLEEPLAAFYACLHKSGEDWRKDLTVGDQVLVVDIGGGTTDFSLISVEDDGGNLKLERTAVGAHLLLGGDNIDLGLAYFVKGKLEEQGHEIDDWQLQALTHACRQAKEKLLSSDAQSSHDITIMGRGSKLIGASLTASLKRDEAIKLVLDGFLPLISPEEHSMTERRAGIQQVGLNYVQDPRISCQLAKFLSQTGESDSNSMQNFILPTAVLFNGGTTKAEAFRERLMTMLNQWAKASDKPEVREIQKPDYDFAVSRGAVYYGMARQGKGIRIRNGTSRSYYIGVEDSAPAVPGVPTPLRALCVVPFGMEEGSEIALESQEFALVLGEPTTFRFFSHATAKLPDGRVPIVGDVVKRWKQDLTELHPIETALEKSAEDGKTVQVRLTSKITELGMLELWCQADDGRKWKLEFDVRK